MAWSDTKVSESADRDAWSLIARSGRFLADRFDADVDPVEHDSEACTVYRYGKTRVLYRVRYVASGNGCKLDWVWREDPDGL